MKKTRLSLKHLNDLTQRFIASLKNKRPETRGTYERALREFARWFAADRHIRFQVEDIERYKQFLTHTKKLSGVSVSTYLTAVRRFCDYLVRIGMLDANPAEQVGGNKRPTSHSRGVLSPTDVERLLISIDRSSERGLRDYAIVKLMLDCALSEIETVRANVDDRRSMNGARVLFVQGKGRTKKDEAVLLSEDADHALDAYLAARSTHNTPRTKPDIVPLFVSASNRTYGRRMSTRGVRERVNEHLQNAGLRRANITPYSLRHTAALTMAQRGAGPDEIRQRMRLGSIATAMLYVNHPERLTNE